VRCYGSDVNTYAALQIHRALGVPYVVSIHTARDESPEPRRLPQRIIGVLSGHLERRALRGAARVMPVYRAILPELDRLGVARVEVAYNVLNPEHLRRKTDYSLHHPVRVLTVGRQLPLKRPDALIRAVASLPMCHLTVIGDGPAHAELRMLADSLGLGRRILFRASMPNDELCASLPDYDIFAAHSDYCELPKAILEPLLTGLPVVMNRRAGSQVPEFNDHIMVLVENTTEGYRAAIQRLVEDNGGREALGVRAYGHAQAHWAPPSAEQQVARIYRDVMGSSR
jgi:glycosyltransferase involved in cell wall biosynthesis